MHYILYNKICITKIIIKIQLFWKKNNNNNNNNNSSLSLLCNTVSEENKDKIENIQAKKLAAQSNHKQLGSLGWQLLVKFRMIRCFIAVRTISYIYIYHS